MFWINFDQKIIVDEYGEGGAQGNDMGELEDDPKGKGKGKGYEPNYDATKGKGKGYM